jgi:hypothetical protein
MESLLQQLVDKNNYQNAKDYNKSFMPTMGGETPDTNEWYNAPIAVMYELCREFEIAHESDHDDKDIYTSDDAFPDSYNHKIFMHDQMVDDREMEWERTKMNRTSTRTMWQKIATWKEKSEVKT